MDILQVARILRPGTAWTCDIIDGQEVNLRQADDGTPRVTVPDQSEIDAYLASHPDPIILARQKVQDDAAPLHERFNALVQILGI